MQITTNSTNLHSQETIAKRDAVREGVLRKAKIMPPSLVCAEPAIRDWVHSRITDDEWLLVQAKLEDRLRQLP